MPSKLRQAIANKAYNLISGETQVLKFGKGYFYTTSATKLVKDVSTVAGQKAAYDYCPPLNAIINRKAEALLNGKWWLLDKDGKEVTNAKAKAIKDLLDRPNPLQTWEQFIAQAYVYGQIYEEVFIFGLTPAGFTGPENIKAMWVIPNWLMEVKLTGKHFMQTDISEIIEGYYITGLNGVRTKIDMENILHIRGNNQNVEEPIRGQSRIKALQDPISNIVAAYEARNVLITRRGAIGILSNTSKDVAGTIPVSKDDKTDLQRDFQMYGLNKEQSQVIITSASLTWQSMTFPTKDLMLFEEIEDDVRQICDNYTYPMHLLGFKAGTTFSNMSEAKKSLYQDAIIPESNRFAKAITSFLNTEKYGFTVSVTYDHLEVFQQSEKDKAEAFTAKVTANMPLLEKNIITLNAFLTALDLEIRQDGDKFLSDIQSVPYALKLGVGGTQALQAILSDPNIADARKRSILIVIFGLSDSEATQIISAA